MYSTVNMKIYCHICTCPVWFHFTCLCTLLRWNWKILVFYDQGKMMLDLNMSHKKKPGFVSFPLFGFTVVIKLRNVGFKSHWNTWVFFDRKIYGVRFEYASWDNVWFCFISIVLVHCSHKTEKCWFWKSLKYLNVFQYKKWCQIWLCPVKQCLIWFKLRCLSRILAISWEIQILYLIKIV